MKLNRSQLQLAWAAGFLDGEGCVRIARRRTKRNPTYSLEVTVSQNCIRTLDHLKQVLGVPCGGSLIHKGTGRVRSNVYYLTYRSRNALEVLRLLQPFLVRKRREAELGIEFAEHVTRVQWQRLRNPDHAHSPIEIAFREAFYQRLRDLKPRGQIEGGAV